MCLCCYRDGSHYLDCSMVIARRVNSDKCERIELDRTCNEDDVDIILKS